MSFSLFACSSSDGSAPSPGPSVAGTVASAGGGAAMQGLGGTVAKAGAAPAASGFGGAAVDGAAGGGDVAGRNTAGGLAAGSGGGNNPTREACSQGAVGTAEGDLMEDFALLDQNGQVVHLSDYCGSVVFLEMGAMWCPQCKKDAQGIAVLAAEHEAEGLVVLSVMAENASSEAPNRSDLVAWASAYGITTPVLADPDWTVWQRYFIKYATPQQILVGRDGKIIDLGYNISWQVEGAL